jgi:hypothetical protein
MTVNDAPIKPQVAGYELEDEWNDSNSQFNNTPGRWFRVYDVFLANRAVPKTGALKRIVDTILARYDTFPGFLTHYVVASPAMKQNPPDDLKDEIATAFVQERLDENAAIAHLKSLLDEVSANDKDDLQTKLSRFMYILPKQPRR